MIWIKVYVTQGEILLAACDEDLLGKTFYEGDLQLCVSDTFYGGEKVTDKDFSEHMRNATIANLVGSEVIRIASEMGMVHEDCIIEIKGIPHAQIARMM